MSDYTQTPNLGLYKPNYALDVGQWGNHLNLNQDVLDAALTGSINAETFTNYNHRAQTGGTMNTPLGIYGELSGVRTGGNPYFTGVKINSDTMDAGGGGLAGLAVVMNGGVASGAMGGRSAIGAQINF